MTLGQANTKSYIKCLKQWGHIRGYTRGIKERHKSYIGYKRGIKEKDTSPKKTAKLEPFIHGSDYL